MSTSTSYVPPSQHRQLRACMVCSIVQPYAKFQREGCPNCDFLELHLSAEAIAEYTSQVYEGLVMMGNPEGSWVAKWQRLEGYVGGVYAVKVVGSLSQDAVDLIESAGVKYIP